MPWIFTLLMAPGVPFMGAVFWLGFGLRSGAPVKAHFTAAFLMVIYLLFVHIVVMFMLIGSGAGVKEAITAYPWAPEVLERLRRLKRRVLPLAGFSMALAVGTAWIGAAAHVGAMPGTVHLGLAIATAALNLFAFAREYGALRENSALMAEVNERMEAGSEGKPLTD